MVLTKDNNEENTNISNFYDSIKLLCGQLIWDEVYATIS